MLCFVNVRDVVQVDGLLIVIGLLPKYRYIFYSLVCGGDGVVNINGRI